MTPTPLSPPDPPRSDTPLLAKPSPEAMQAARHAFKQAREEIEHFGATEDFTRSPIEAALSAAYEIDGIRSMVPEMALRPDHENADLMDDVVVKDVTMFRAEQMDDTVWWACCYFANDERVTFHLRARSRPMRLEVSVTERPPEWRDIDQKKEASDAS